MIRLVDEAASSKAPIAKLADKVAGVFVPVVIAIAVVTAAVWLIATGGDVTRPSPPGWRCWSSPAPAPLDWPPPVAIMVGTGKGAENGILIKSAEALETLHTIQTVVLDKTGTLTQGKPVVTDCRPAPGVTEEELLCLAASLEKPSEHPWPTPSPPRLRPGTSPGPCGGLSGHPGPGYPRRHPGSAAPGGQPGHAGGGRRPAGRLRRGSGGLAQAGKTPLYFAGDGRMLGVVAVADTPSPPAQRLSAPSRPWASTWSCSPATTGAPPRRWAVSSA